MMINASVNPLPRDELGAFQHLTGLQGNFSCLSTVTFSHLANHGGDGIWALVGGEVPLSGKMLCQIYLPVAFRSLMLGSGEIATVNQV